MCAETRDERAGDLRRVKAPVGLSGLLLVLAFAAGLLLRASAVPDSRVPDSRQTLTLSTGYHVQYNTVQLTAPVSFTDTKKCEYPV